jgi:parallel beta-helix repeat protein
MTGSTLSVQAPAGNGALHYMTVNGSFASDNTVHASVLPGAITVGSQQVLTGGDSRFSTAPLTATPSSSDSLISPSTTPSSSGSVTESLTSASTKVGPQAPAPVGPATIYVSPTGSDANNGRSSATPFRTIGKAASVAVAGDTVYVRGGTYNEYVAFYNSGTSTRPITFAAAPGEHVVINGSGRAPNPSNPYNNAPLVRVAGSYVTVRDFEIQNAATYGVYVTGHNVTLDALNVHNTYEGGIMLYNTSSCIVQNSVVHDAYDYGQGGDNADGIWLGWSGGGHIIRYNNVYHNSDDGIDTWRSSSNQIYGNLVHNNGQGSSGDGNGLKLGPGGSNTVYQNASYDNRADGFTNNSASNNNVYNNTGFRNGGYNFDNYVYSNTYRNNISYSGSVHMQAAIQSSNSWNLGISDPRFISTDPTASTFLWLSSTSPAIDRGTNVGLPYDGAAIDLGAYES